MYVHVEQETTGIGIAHTNNAIYF